MASVSQLLALLDRQADELLKLEELAAGRASRELRASIRAIAADAKRRWAELGPEPGPVQLLLFQSQLAGEIETLKRIRIDLTSTAEEAVRLGISHGLEQGTNLVQPSWEIPAEVAATVAMVSLTVARQLDQASKLAKLQGFDLDQTLAAAFLTVTRAESSGRWLVTRASSYGVTLVGQRNDLDRVWRAERDGCLGCMAYSGKIQRRGRFPGDLTFGTKPLTSVSIPGPPLHPNCRCQLALLPSDDHRAAEALAREARRSVIKGWSLESESESERLKAADRLLRQGAGLPKTVEERARASVRAAKEGRRKFRRPVP
jgi:hypothetical protein